MPDTRNIAIAPDCEASRSAIPIEVEARWLLAVDRAWRRYRATLAACERGEVPYVFTAPTVRKPAP